MPDDDPTRLDPHFFERLGELFECRGRQRCEDLIRAEQLELLLGDARRTVDPGQPWPGGNHEQRQQRPGDDQRTPRAEPVEQQRCHQRTEPDREQEEALEHTEDAREHVLWSRALHQGHSRDVDERVPDADEGEQDEDGRLVRPHRDERDRDSPDEDPDPEVRCEATPPDQRRRGQRADQASDADRRVEETDSRLPCVEQLERDDHDQDVQHPVDERLRTEEPDQQPQPTFAHNRPEAGEQFVDDGDRLSLLDRRLLDRPHSDQRAPPTTARRRR